MSVYPEGISERMHDALSRRSCDGSNCAGTGASFECGCFVRLRLRIDPQTKVIEEVGVESNGCGYMLASVDVLSHDFMGRSLKELRGLDREALTRRSEDVLGPFPANRVSCREACVDALEVALENFRSSQLEEFRGEKALVCTCFSVTEERVESLIASGSVETVEDLSRACNAGSGCGSCRMMIQELLDNSGSV